MRQPIPHPNQTCARYYARAVVHFHAQQRNAALGLGRQFKQFAATRRIKSVAVYFANDGELDLSGLMTMVLDNGQASGVAGVTPDTPE